MAQRNDKYRGMSFLERQKARAQDALREVNQALEEAAREADAYRMGTSRTNTAGRSSSRTQTPLSTGKKAQEKPAKSAGSDEPLFPMDDILSESENDMYARRNRGWDAYQVREQEARERLQQEEENAAAYVKPMVSARAVRQERDALRRAVIWSEIIGKPAAQRHNRPASRMRFDRRTDSLHEEEPLDE